MTRDRMTAARTLPADDGGRGGVIRVRDLYARDGGLCWICGTSVDWPDASRDHVVPKSKGGGDHSENLKLAHKACNNKRGTPDEIVAVGPPRPTKRTREGKSKALRKAGCIVWYSAATGARVVVVPGVGVVK